MFDFVQKILYFFMELQEKRLKKNLSGTLQTSFENSTSKMVFNNGNTLTLTSKTQKTKDKLAASVTSLLKKYENNPQKLLEFMEKNGTPVKKFNHADKLLAFVNETEGVVNEADGFKALYLNLITDSGFSFHSEPMFISRDLPLDSYAMIHQFHMWYAMKLKLPGFDSNTQKNFKKLMKKADNDEITSLNMNEIISLKEAIARDVEAINFVVEIAKSTEGSKKAMQKITAGGASV